MDIDLPDVVAEVKAAFEAYERALVANDVAALDAMFHDDPRTIRFGGSESLFGYAQIKAFRATRSPAGLARTLSRTVITAYGRDTAVASTLFHRLHPVSSHHHARQRGATDADLGTLSRRLARSGGACERDSGGIRILVIKYRHRPAANRSI